MTIFTPEKYKELLVTMNKKLDDIIKEHPNLKYWAESLREKIKDQEFAELMLISISERKQKEILLSKGDVNEIYTLVRQFNYIQEIKQLKDE